METEYIKKSALERQREVLIQSLEQAAQNDGLFLNVNYKLAPHFYNKNLQISPINALMMAMHSDNKNCVSNAYITFQQLQEFNTSVRKGQKGVPFTWYSQNEYIEVAHPDNKISKSDYNKLPESDKVKYKVNSKENIFTLFNIDQTTLPFIHKEDYKSHISSTGQAEPREDKEKRIEVNNFIKKMKANLLPIRRDGIGVAYYDEGKDLIHIPPQKDFSTYPEYIQALTREIVHATGVSKRLNRPGVSSTNEDLQIRESLLEDLVSSHKLLEFGMPSRLSKTTFANIPSIIAKLNDSPEYMRSLFDDINRTVGMIKKAENGEKIKTICRETEEATISPITAQTATQTPLRFPQITMIKDDDNKWTLVARPEAMKAFAIHPSKQDISAYFDSLKFPNKEEGVKFREEFAQKYYDILSQNPELKVDVFSTDATPENINRIDKVNIYRSRDQKNMLVAYVDNKPLQPVELSKSQYQKLWLSDDRNAYKMSLAASIYAQQLSDTKSNQVSQTESKNVRQEIKTQETKEAQTDLNPFLQSFDELKKKYPDCILLFRRNNNYLIFANDANTASEKLSIPLNYSQNCKEKDGSNLRIISLHFSQLDIYLPQLIRSGLRVAICDYVEPKPKEGQQDTQKTVEAVKQQEQIKETVARNSSLHR